MSRALEILEESFNAAAQLDLSIGEYMHMLGIRGDYNSQRAKYFRYLDARELYPEFKSMPLDSDIEGRLSGIV
jgi:hypothetical protein